MVPGRLLQAKSRMESNCKTESGEHSDHYFRTFEWASNYIILNMLDLVHKPGECILQRKKTAKLACNIRTYYPDGYRKRAAGLCFRSESKNEVLLVSSSRSSNAWVIPGGGLEPNEDSSCAAVRELLEEAGVTGTVIGTLGPFDDITANGTKHRTSVYSFVVTEEFELWEDKLRIGRVRKWFPIEDALRQLRLYKPNQERYLRKAVMDT